MLKMGGKGEKQLAKWKKKITKRKKTGLTCCPDEPLNTRLGENYPGSVRNQPQDGRTLREKKKGSIYNK